MNAILNSGAHSRNIPEFSVQTVSKLLGGTPHTHTNTHTQKYIIHIFVLSSVSLKKHNFKINTFLSVRIQSVHTEQNFKVSAMTYLTGHCIPKLNRIVCNWVKCTTL